MCESDGVVNGRYTYRLRVSNTARCALLADWDRCRWVWNQCVATSRQARESGMPIGPAALDKKLTGWRSEHEWLSAGPSVPQQQMIRDFGRARSKAIKDIESRVPQHRRTGMPRFKKKGIARPSLNYSRRGFRIKDDLLRLAGGAVLRVVWSRELPAPPTSARVFQDGLGHWYVSFVVAVRVQALPPTGRAIGIDWGVTETATTTSDGHNLPHPPAWSGRCCEACSLSADDGPSEVAQGQTCFDRVPRREAAVGQAAEESGEAPSR
ncbi:RNA-guided endonuclease InsQ/TnpB family protein [Nocardia sp. NPDC020380]|uniref:RNA-guided endonuclease InsQ/TnpB family protein n=1 Tax=Nocardia sp. NPDC020380 TaxID=3364309 RepID=UPI0037A399C1